jgi:UDP-3-O-acyl-N-acetylglucosamine deacetylase
VTPTSFQQQLSAARTFLLKTEAEELRRRGLGARVRGQNLLVFDDFGPIDNSLRFEDECVRHKALDMVGDLALMGCDIHGRVIARRSGHELNAALVSSLMNSRKCVEDSRKIA